jgi:ubiquitin C-terminal hydrolase
MTEIILFYQDNLRANNKDGYFYSDIISWSDYRLDVEHDFIQWLFPDRTGGVNPDAPKLTDDDIEIFRTDKKIRKNVIRATSRILQFYGYMFTKDGVFQVQDLNRQEKGRYIGLYSEHNYRRLTRIMKFLNKIDMRKASSLMMLALCYAMHKDIVLREKIKKTGALKHWFQTQKYLRPYADTYDIIIMGVREEKEDDNEEEKFQTVCKFTGLNYTGNSCYQDSTLLALFAIPNKFISANILEKNIRPISNKANREIVCGENSETDFQRRRAIQQELVRITKSMRGELPHREHSQYCSNLRGLIRVCPSASRQAFYGTGTQDAGEFLQYLFALFQVGGMFRSRSTIVTNDLSDIPRNTMITHQVMEETSPVVLISSHTIRQIPRANINYFLNHKEDSVFDEENMYRADDGRLYRRRIEQVTVATGDYLVFYAQRLYVEGRKAVRTYNKIIPTEKIKLDKNLQLFSIIVHRRSHYTAYIKCDKKWFYYNDLNNSIVPIGTYQDMLNEKSKPNVTTEGVIYFYKAELFSFATRALAQLKTVQKRIQKFNKAG